jgi:hypothetical protein
VKPGWLVWLLGMGLILAWPLAAQTEAGIQDSTSLIQRPCANRDTVARLACQDSIIQEMSRRDSLLKTQAAQWKRSSVEDEDASDVQSERTSRYFFGFLGDWSVHGMGSKDLAEALYVVAVVAVVGGTLIYLPVMLYRMARNQQQDPIHHEFALTYAYSGSNWEGGGQPLYRDTYMPGMRYSLVVAHPVVALGLSIEGGYLASHFEEALWVTPETDLRGGYGLIGPMLRFGALSPVHFSLEFLNGMSTAQAIGWISKARANVQMKVGNHGLVGLNLGSLFYDMHFFDGTVWREGRFNRDLSLSIGLEGGYRF